MDTLCILQMINGFQLSHTGHVSLHGFYVTKINSNATCVTGESRRTVFCLNIDMGMIATRDKYPGLVFKSWLFKAGLALTLN